MYFTDLPTAWWDSSYSYRKELTITAGSEAIPSDYSVSLTFDHAALVGAGSSQSNGDDIRITYWNGSDWDELDRMLDPGSDWNTTTTKIWSRLKLRSLPPRQTVITISTMAMGQRLRHRKTVNMCSSSTMASKVEIPVLGAGM